MMMKKNIKLLFISFTALFFLVFFMMLAKGIGKIERPIIKDIFVLGTLAFIMFIISAHLFTSKFKIFKNQKMIIPFFFMTVFVINIFFAIRLNDIIKPVSDFELAYNKAIHFTTNTQYDLYYPWWTNFSIFLKTIFSFFGSNLLIVSIMNSILSTLSCYFVYLIAKKHLKFNQLWAFLPALLFALYPSRLFFLPFVAPDFIAEFGFILVSFLFFNYLDLFLNEHATKKTYIYPAILAILVLFFSLFKPMQEIFLILFLIILTIKSLPSFSKSAKRLCYFVIVFLCIILSGNFIHAKLFESYTNIKVDKSLIMMNKLYVGLNSEGRGYWNPINERYLAKLEKTYNSDTTKITQSIKTKLINDIKHNPTFPKLISDKLETAFISDFYGIEWINLSLKTGRVDIIDLEKPVYLSNLYYYFILLFALFALISINKTKNLKSLYFVVFLLGFTAVVLIGESQTRYKLAFLFNFILLASVGIKYIAEYKLEQKIKKFLKEN